MKFKVGDKVRVTNAVTDHRRKYIDKIYTIKDVNARGLSYYTRTNVNYYYMKEAECHYVFYEDELELVAPANFTKSDLKDGMVVEYVEGQRRMVLGDRIIAKDVSKELKHYNEHLEETTFSHQTINKVYKTTANFIADIFDDKYLTLIWERPKEESVKEMTVEEIEKELGYKVKIVSEVN